MLENVITGNPDGHHEIVGGKLNPPAKAKNEIPSSSSKLKSLPQAVKINMKLLKMVPKIRTSFTSVNIIHDFHYVNKYRTFDEVNNNNYYYCSTFIIIINRDTCC